jgi:hypothetical protein
MTRRRFSPWGALLCALALIGPAAAAPVPVDKDSPLAQVPAKAPIVVQLRGIDRTRERLEALIKNAVPDWAEAAKAKIDEGLKMALQGRELKGIKEGPIFLVFTELPTENTKIPQVAILVPVTKYETFRDAAGFVKKGDSLKLSKEFARRLLDADLAVYVDMAAVHKQYGEYVKKFRDEMERALDQTPDKSIAEQAKRVYKSLFQAVDDSSALLASVDLTPQGARFHAEVEVPANSETNKLLKDWKALPTADLGKLPADSLIYTATTYTPALLKEWGPMMFGITSDPDSKEGKAVAKAVAELSDAKPRRALGAMTLPLGGLQVWTYDDPAKAVAGQLKLFGALKEGTTYQSGVLKGDPAVKEKAEKHAGFEFHHASLKWDLEKTVDRQAAAAALPADAKAAMVEYMRSFLGDGQEVWFGTDGKAVLQVTAKDWAAAKALIDRYRKGDPALADEAGFKEALKQLPADASFVGLIDVPRTAEAVVPPFLNMMQALGATVPVPAGFGKPAVKGKAGFWGVAVTLAPERGSFDLWVSANSVDQIYKMYIESLIKMNQ